MKQTEGMTLLELLATLTVVSLCIILAGPGLGGFLRSMTLHRAVGQVLSSLHQARTAALTRNRRVQYRIAGHTIFLDIREGGEWRRLHRYPLDEKISIQLSAQPSFYPHGVVAPLFSLRLWNRKRGVRISVSMAGRWKVRPMSPPTTGS